MSGVDPKGFDRQAIMRLNRIKAAVDQRDLSALKGNRFEKLKGDRPCRNPLHPNRSMRAADLARAMGVDRGRMSRLINGRTAVTGETAILLSRVFGTSPEFWMRLQADYDLALAREAMG